jgi:hypothetical protein
VTGVQTCALPIFLVLATLPAVPAVKETMPQATKVTEVPVDNATAEAITEASKAAAA